jgi:hypothetical protein
MRFHARAAGNTAGGQGRISNPPDPYLIFRAGYTARTLRSALLAFFLKSYQP